MYFLKERKKGESNLYIDRLQRKQNFQNVDTGNSQCTSGEWPQPGHMLSVWSPGPLNIQVQESLSCS